MTQSLECSPLHHSSDECTTIALKRYQYATYDTSAAGQPALRITDSQRDVCTKRAPPPLPPPPRFFDLDGESFDE
eukprot:scaffold302357_cov43-Tisochrysis_lutea.AAC.2